MIPHALGLEFYQRLDQSTSGYHHTKKPVTPVTASLRCGDISIFSVTAQCWACHHSYRPATASHHRQERAGSQQPLLRFFSMRITNVRKSVFPAHISFSTDPQIYPPPWYSCLCLACPT